MTLRSEHKNNILSPSTGIAPPVTNGTRSSQGKRVSSHLWAGCAMIGIIIFSAVFAPLLSPVEPDVVRSTLRLSPPGPLSFFGTDSLGRDVFSRVLFGSRFALYMSLLSTLLSTVPGSLLGLIAGYKGGWIDDILSRLMDAWLAFPGLLFAIILVARLGPSLSTTIIALGLMGTPSFFRITRSGTFSVKQMDYVLCARATGVPSRRIIFRHILPNLSSSLAVFSTMRLGTMILAGSGLSYIGLGIQPPMSDWGAMLASSRNLLREAWWMAAFPGMAITITVLGFNLLGDGLRDYLAVETKK